MFHIFHFLKSDMVYGVVNPSWKGNAISSEKSQLPDFNHVFPVNLH